MVNIDNKIIAQVSNLSRNIKLLMQYHGLTISELARRANLPKTTLFSIINDENHDPRIQTIIPIANLFNITINELLSDQLNLEGHGEKIIPVIDWSELSNYIYSQKKTNKYININIKVKTSDESFILKTTKSLRPIFLDNTLLIFDPAYEYDNGDIVLVKDNNSHNFFIKELYYSDSIIYMMPINIEIESNIIYNQNQHTIIATLIGSVFNCELNV